MREFDHKGQILCDIQASIFADSIHYSCSSPIFIRRFMNSDYCRIMDQEGYLSGSEDYSHVYDSLDAQYGVSQYGKVKYSVNELTWIGYLYRYWAYVYECSSRQVYRIAKGKDLQELFYAYHSLDPGQAIERILEARQVVMPQTLSEEERIRQGVMILRQIRAGA